MAESPHAPMRQGLREGAVDRVKYPNLHRCPPAAGGRELRVKEAAFPRNRPNWPHAAMVLRQQGVTEHLHGKHRVGARVVDVGIQRRRDLIAGTGEIHLNLVPLRRSHRQQQ